MSFLNQLLSLTPLKPATASATPTPLPRLTRYAHRGLALKHTENTLDAFAAAVAAGAHWIEIDIHATSDGDLMIFHDETLNRVAGISGRIDQKTFAEVRDIELPGGELIPTLFEAIVAFPQLQFNIDLKDEGSARGIGQVLAETGAANRVRLTSFSEERLRLARQSLREANVQVERWGASEQTMIAFYLIANFAPFSWSLVRRLPFISTFDALQIPTNYKILGHNFPVLTRKVIDAAHRFGYRVDVWTIDDPTTIKYLADAGIDGIVTNRVDTLTQLATS